MTLTCARFRLVLPLYVVLFCVNSGASLAATIAGRVTTPAGDPISGVMVTAVHTETEYGGVAYTNDGGQFRIEDLPSGAYHVVSEKTGYGPEQVSVTLGTRPETTLAIELLKVLGSQPILPNTPRPKNYQTIPVFYGTDRKPEKGPDGALRYGAERGTLDLGVCMVSVPRDHRIGALESPAWWKFEFRPDPAKHIAVLSTEALDKDAFVTKMTAMSSPRNATLVFVHGFNVTFEDAARRAAQLAADLKVKNPPLLYSWGSNGATLSYLADGEQALRAVPFLTSFLELVMSRTKFPAMHLIAHSMGNRVLTGALQQIAPARAGQTPIGQIALVAPDIDEEVFRTQIAPKITRVGRRRTLYASTRDQALILSKQLHKAPRAGDVTDLTLLPDGMDTIDATAVDTSFIGHSYFADNRSVIADIFNLFARDTPPPERFGMQPATIGRGQYWKFTP